MRISGADGAVDESTMRTEMFRRVDQDGDGKITKEELTQAAPSQGEGGMGLDIDELFNQIDSNQDGVIDETENDDFMSSMSSKRARPSGADFAQKLFEKADTDGDGKLTQEEMLSALPQQSSSSSSSALDTLFKEADEDGDGTISQAELEASVNKRLAESVGTYTRDGDTTDLRGPRFNQYA